MESDIKEMLDVILIGMNSLSEKFKARFDAMETKLNSMQSDITSIKLDVETSINPHIKLLAEGFSGYAERLPQVDQMAEDITETKLDVAIVKAVLERQSKDISKLKIVK